MFRHVRKKKSKSKKERAYSRGICLFLAPRCSCLVYGNNGSVRVRRPRNFGLILLEAITSFKLSSHADVGLSSSFCVCVVVRRGENQKMVGNLQPVFSAPCRGRRELSVAVPRKLPESDRMYGALSGFLAGGLGAPSQFAVGRAVS